MPTDISSHPATQILVEGDNATFRCIIYNSTGTMLAAFGWERVDSNGLVYHIFTGPRYYYSATMNTQVLTITNLSIDDAGDYNCVAYRKDINTNNINEERSNYSTLQVIG